MKPIAEALLASYRRCPRNGGRSKPKRPGSNELDEFGQVLEGLLHFVGVLVRLWEPVVHDSGRPRTASQIGEVRLGPNVVEPTATAFHTRAVLYQLSYSGTRRPA
jgi:hypothetical protein